MSKKKTLIIITLIVLIPTVFALVCAARVYTADKEARAFAGEHSFSTSYEIAEQPAGTEAFLREICSLAAWEQKTEAQIDQAYSEYGFLTEDRQGNDGRITWGYESGEELRRFSMKKQWRKAWADLDRGVETGVKELFGKEQQLYGIEREALLACYENGHFDKLVSIVNDLDSGKGEDAYQEAGHASDKDWDPIPMDVAYGLYPDVVLAGCVEDLKAAMETNKEWTIKDAVTYAEAFSDRYQAEVPNLKSAQRKAASLEYAGKPAVPKVGMSVSAASSTRLGPPTRKTTERQSWSHQKHTFGEMYWESGGRQIFKAHYMDGKITDVSDTRGSSGRSYGSSSGRTSGSSSGRTSGYSSSGKTSSSSSRFDPDDHDIESFYDDNRDEYDSYDDAYDDFMDDEDLWDDY